MSGKFKVAARIAWRKVDDEVILLDLTSSDYYTINGTGSMLWEALAGGKSVEQSIGDLCRDFSAEPDVVRKDLAAFLKGLKEKKFLEPA